MKKELISIINRLKAEQKSITFAESCTGGRIASAFTAIAGVSEVFNGSCVTYSNQIKHGWLDVEQDTLDKHGAVSQECVEQMCQGAMKLADANYAISVSGIAGPDGGTVQKPVGTVYIAVGSRDEILATKHQFTGNRENIQGESTAMAIALFDKFLQKCK